MAEQESLYLQALDNLELYSDKIREIFLEHAGEDGIVDMNRIGDLMNELHSVIGIDLGKAKDFFSKSNSAIPDSFNLDATTFDDFIGLLKIWIQRKSGKRAKPTIDDGNESELSKGDRSLEEIPTVESNPGSERVPKVAQKKKSVDNDDVSQGKGRKNSQGKKPVNRNMIIPPPGYKKNRERLDELLLKHREDYHQKFYERQDEETEKISSIDFFIFLQDCFSIDTMMLKEKASNEQGFFQSQSSFETLMKIAESYFLNVREVEAEEFEIRNVRLTFNECFDILDHWFQTDGNVVLVYEHEKFSSNNTASSAQSEVKKVLLDTIAKYKVMIDEAKTEVEKMVLQGTVDTLYEKLKQLDGDDHDEERRRMQQKQNKKREEKKIKALKEIFEFYAKQQLNGVKPVTFANLEKQFRTISMGKFSVILKNFKMKIDNFKLREMYKKIAVSDDLNFEEFYDLLQKVSREVELIKELKVIKPNPDIMKEYKPDSYKKSLSMKENIKGEQGKRAGLNSRKNEADKMEEMWEHMGLYDGSYRSNMQQVQLAFNSQEKESFRIDPESIKNKSKKLHYEEKITEEIKEDIAKRNRLREVIKDVKRVENKALNNYRIPVKQEPYFNLPKPDSYAQQAKKEKMIPLLEKKMTLKDVGNSKYSEMRERGFDPKFNPQDLIEENDEEDNYYLAEYNLTVALAKPQQIVPQSQKELPLREDIEQYKATEMTRSKSTKRQSMAADGRYSRMYESKATRVGTTSPQPTSVAKGRSKPSTSDENEYMRNLPSQSGISSGSVNRSLVHISQSVKNLIPNPSNSNMRNYGHIYESQFEINNRPLYQVQRPEKIGNNEGNKKMGNGMVDRLTKIQQDSKKREYEIMSNLLNIQNTKLEQGLRVARK